MQHKVPGTRCLLALTPSLAAYHPVYARHSPRPNTNRPLVKLLLLPPQAKLSEFLGLMPAEQLEAASLQLGGLQAARAQP